jgi:hypothetical protein
MNARPEKLRDRQYAEELARQYWEEGSAGDPWITEVSSAEIFRIDEEER